MCGITGGISFNGEFFPAKDELSKAASFLKYRGPDDRAELFLEQLGVRVAFAHRRLSIIDLSPGGRQPMKSASGRSCIVFNGEIYNYRSLKTELEGKQFVFNTLSDTEVILNSFECWGIEGALQRLDGMFAFALFDFTNNTLFLARDRFGKKPLYFFHRDRQLCFSSDIRSFQVIKSIPLSIDMHALGYLFSELSTPLEHTIWQSVKKLMPSSYLAFDGSGVKAYKEYSDVSYSENCVLDRREILSKTEYLLGAAVKKRLVSDVRVAALLSGGIDSSLVVAKMCEHTSGKVKTYSVGFKEDQFNELPYSRRVAEMFDTDHTEIILHADSLLDVRDLILEFGEPFADASMLPTYWISKEVGKSEKVLLGGDGGDELFGGYYGYYFARRYDTFKSLGFLWPLARMCRKVYPSYKMDLFLKVLLQTRKPSYSLLSRGMGFTEDELKHLCDYNVFFESMANEHKSIWERFTSNSSHDSINLMEASLRTRLVNDYLVKVDRATMYASLEMRSPFLDKDLSDFAFSLKPEQIHHKGRPKSILKEIAGKYFGSDFIHRNKMGFGVPVGEWFKGEFSDHVRELILGGRQKVVDLNYGFIESVIKSHCNGEADHTNKLWALFVFHIWANNE